MTADIPPGPAGVAGLGIVMLAQVSGRPIVPLATATSRYYAFNTWSRMTLNLPFGALAAAATRLPLGDGMVRTCRYNFSLFLSVAMNGCAQALIDSLTTC